MWQSCGTVLEPGGLFSGYPINTMAAWPLESVATGFARWGNVEAWGGASEVQAPGSRWKCAYLNFSKNKLNRSYLFKTWGLS